MAKTIKPYRLKHKPTGLYYTKGTLSEKGKVYTTASNYLTAMGRFDESLGETLTMSVSSKLYSSHKDCIEKLIGEGKAALIEPYKNLPEYSYVRISVKSEDFEKEYFNQEISIDQNRKLTLEWLMTQEINGILPTKDIFAESCGVSAAQWQKDECNCVYASKLDGSDYWAFIIHAERICEAVKKSEHKCRRPLLPEQRLYISTEQEFLMLRSLIKF